MSSFGLLSLFALELIPIVSTITATVSAITLIGSGTMAYNLVSQITKVNENLKRLDQYEQELEHVMECIREQELWMNNEKMIYIGNNNNDV